MLVLGEIRANAICGGTRRNAGVANRQSTDIPRSGKISFHQRRRNFQHVCDVVEPTAFIIGRKERRCVDIQCQKVANDILVFGTIQSMHHDMAGIRFCRCCAIERGFEEAGKCVQCRFVRSRHSRRRHHANPYLSDYLFPGFCVFRDVCQVGVLQRKPAGARLVIVTGHTVGVQDSGLSCGERLQRPLLRADWLQKNGGKPNAESEDQHSGNHSDLPETLSTERRKYSAGRTFLPTIHAPGPRKRGISRLESFSKAPDAVSLCSLCRSTNILPKM